MHGCSDRCSLYIICWLSKQGAALAQHGDLAATCMQHSDTCTHCFLAPVLHLHLHPSISSYWVE